MNGNLYQLVSRLQLNVGTYVQVNGPHDKFGYVIKSDLHPEGFLNLIRGCQERKCDRPFMQF